MVHMAEDDVDARPAGARVAIGVIALLAVVGVVVFLLVRDGDDEVTTPGTTTTAPTSSAVPASTTTEPPTSTAVTGGLTSEEAATVVWPAPDGAVRYADPVEAARGFAGFAGFAEPLVGELKEGDQRSGEVDVRATEQGPVTTVLVRRMSDDHWWVLGAATDDIVLDDPQPGGAIDDPLQLSGRARAFEGTVQVAVLERGGTEPLGTGVVTGSGGGELGPFEGEVRWSNPGGGWGVVLLFTESMEDGRVWQAAAVPVGFIGGD